MVNFILVTLLLNFLAISQISLVSAADGGYRYLADRSFDIITEIARRHLGGFPADLGDFILALSNLNQEQLLDLHARLRLAEETRTLEPESFMHILNIVVTQQDDSVARSRAAAQGPRPIVASGAGRDYESSDVTFDQLISLADAYLARDPSVYASFRENIIYITPEQQKELLERLQTEQDAGILNTESFNILLGQVIAQEKPVARAGASGGGVGGAAAYAAAASTDPVAPRGGDGDRLLRAGADGLDRGTFAAARLRYPALNTEDPVLLEEFEADARVVVLPCQHVLAEDSYNQLLRTDNKCPLCRVVFGAGAGFRAVAPTLVERRDAIMGSLSESLRVRIRALTQGQLEIFVTLYETTPSGDQPADSHARNILREMGIR